MTQVVIETNNLTKVYGSGKSGFKALEKLNLTVNRGEIFGYLGPNGAGKTTTIRMLLDLIRPTEGYAKIFGKDAQSKSIDIHKHVGFLPGELSLWNNEKSIDIIKYFGRIRGGVDMNYINSLATRLQFDVKKRVRDYSTGNKRKLGLILALMHQPELLILDEPTSGLDPLMQQTFNQLMMEWRDAGRTVFLSSHVLSEVQAICDRVAVLRHGELKAVERIETLTQVDFRWVTVEFREKPVIDRWITDIPGVSDVSKANGYSIKLRLTGDFDPVLKAVQNQYVVNMHVQEPSLEEIFLAFYDDNKSAPQNPVVREPMKERV